MSIGAAIIIIYFLYQLYKLLFVQAPDIAEKSKQALAEVPMTKKPAALAWSCSMFFFLALAVIFLTLALLVFTAPAFDNDPTTRIEIIVSTPIP